MTVRPWSTPADVKQAARRRWDSGRLLTDHARGAAFEPIRVPLHGPGPGEAAEDLGRVRAWADALDRGARRVGGSTYDLEMRSIGGRALGRNELPARALVTSYDQAWRLLGVTEEVAAYARIIGTTRARSPELVEWVIDHPLTALARGEVWERLLVTVGWLRSAAGTGRYLREVDVPGVDTKFIEQHRPILADLLDTVPGAAVEPRMSRGRDFALRYGFRSPQPLVRVRFAPGTLPLPAPVAEVGLRVEELAALQVEVRRVLVVENEVTYLSLAVPAGSLVVFGSGFTVSTLGTVPWLEECGVDYWGDLDTHGFAILSRLRLWLPQVRSLLMDRDTLLAHRDRWGVEPSPTRARLEHLTMPEQDLYQDLVEDAFAPSVRLEQERIDWSYADTAMHRLEDRD